MVGSAAVLRACVQGSKFATTNKGSGALNGGEEVSMMEREAVRSIPQIHGPCVDAVDTAVKVLELECNCFPLGGGVAEEDGGRLDRTVMELVGKTILNSVEILLQTCQARMGHEMMEPTDNQNGGGIAEKLERTVAQLHSSLQDEARLNGTFIETELQRATELATKKAAGKAQRAAAHAANITTTQTTTTQTTSTNITTDEFQGMSEGKKAAILKKREVKAKKAAAKAAKKKTHTSTTTITPSIFGAGTLPILTTLKSTNYILATSPTILTSLSSTIHSLLSGGIQRKPKIAKGTRDYLPDQMMIRDTAFQIIRRVFKSHGAVEIDTPVFELKDTLTGKYGEDSKLIYDLADQGGEVLALRYDLTVPFARFLALHAVGNIKRFHIGKVYRRDQPQLSKGRYREFYQCDFDIAGVYGKMVADAECLCVASEILAGLPIGEFGIKLNHRKLLDAILDLCGVEADKFRSICSAVDKLDKEPWSEVKREMVEDKGLSAEVADKIGVFVLQKGEPWKMYHSLIESKVFGKHVVANEAMKDLKILFQYLDAMDKLKYISFDLSLARGLDYYTGVIYEAVCMNGNTQVGSIGGGGRYDTLVSMFQEAGKVTPCVGVSVGIERVFTLMEERLRQEQGGSIKQPNVKVLVAQAGDNMMIERMKVSQLLWDSNISAEFNQQENPKLKFEITNALDRDIPFMVIIGEDEAKENKCKVKDLKARTEETVDQHQLVSTLRGKGVVPIGCEFAAEMMVAEKDKISI